MQNVGGILQLGKCKANAQRKEKEKEEELCLLLFLGVVNERAAAFFFSFGRLVPFFVFFVRFSLSIDENTLIFLDNS